MYFYCFKPIKKLVHAVYLQMARLGSIPFQSSNFYQPDCLEIAAHEQSLDIARACI